MCRVSQTMSIYKNDIFSGHLVAIYGFKFNFVIQFCKIFSGPQSLKPISVPSLLQQITEKVPDHPALRIRDNHGELQDWSYQQYHQQIFTVARLETINETSPWNWVNNFNVRAFISLGLEPLHTVSVLGYPHPCQHISNMAAIHAGGFVGGMYQTNTEVNKI